MAEKRSVNGGNSLQIWLAARILTHARDEGFAAGASKLRPVYGP